MPFDQQRVQEIFEKLSRRGEKLADGSAEDAVHGFRSSCRRVQTLLEDVGTYRGHNEKRLLKLLDRLHKQAGKVRDLDVQISALRSLKIPQQPRHKTQLLAALSAERVKREKKLAKALDKDTVRELRRRAKRAAKKLEVPAGVEPVELARHMAVELASDPGTLTEKKLHDYRIRAKRIRHVAEMAVDSADGARLVKELRGLQDAIGNWHDWLMITERAEKLLGGVRESALVAALHNVTRAKYRNALQVLKGKKAEIEQPPAAPSQATRKPARQAKATSLAA